MMMDSMGQVPRNESAKRFPGVEDNQDGST